MTSPAEPLLDAVAFAIGEIENPRVEDHERSWAALALDAVPDGWAKVNGEWLRVAFEVVPKTAYMGGRYDQFRTEVQAGRYRVLVVERLSSPDLSSATEAPLNDSLGPDSAEDARP